MRGDVLDTRPGAGVRRARVASAIVLALALALVGYLALLNWERLGTDFALALAGLLFAVIGAVVLARTEGNRVGWVLAATGIAVLLSGVAGAWADRGALVGDAVGGAMWLSFFFLIGLLMYWFPTGRPLSPRWRWVGWIGAIVEAFALTYVVAEQLCVDESNGTCSAWVDNPIGITGVPNPEYGALSGVTFGLLVFFALLSAASLVVRFIRARGAERLQIKWFVLAVVNVISVMVVTEILGGLLPLPDLVWDLIFGVSVLALPVAIGVSVTRYRLYEIDRIISRTVSYTLVVGLLALVFFVVVTALTTLLSTDSDLAVAGSTLAVAALFNPLRKRIQGWVDRRFNRSRYDAELVMTGFSEKLREEVDPEAVIDGWVSVVAETMQPLAAGVWVREQP